MKEGKISKAVWDRSVLRPLEKQSVCGRDIVQGQGCSFIPAGSLRKEEDDLQTALSTGTGTVGGRLDLTVQMIVCEAVNNLTVSGMQCIGMMTALLLPPAYAEQQLRQIVSEVSALAHMLHVPILGGDTKISGGVSRPVLTVTAVGSRGLSDKTDSMSGMHRAKADREKRDLIMTGCAGWAGTGILVGAYADRIRQRFPAFMEENALAMTDPETLLVKRPADIALRHRDAVMQDISTGGVLGALWEFCQREGLGMDIDMRAIPVRQETIEICELVGRNPYELFGQGGLIIACVDGAALIRDLADAGIAAGMLGSCFSEKVNRGRMIRNGGEIRYLNKPEADSLWCEE